MSDSGDAFMVERHGALGPNRIDQAAKHTLFYTTDVIASAVFAFVYCLSYFGKLEVIAGEE